MILFNAAMVLDSFQPMYGIIHDAVLWVSFENGTDKQKLSHKWEYSIIHAHTLCT